MVIYVNILLGHVSVLLLNHCEAGSKVKEPCQKLIYNQQHNAFFSSLTAPSPPRAIIVYITHFIMSVPSYVKSE